MGKIKTFQALDKRIIVTKTGKIRKRKSGQNHFNARESGNIVRMKRRDINAMKEYRKTIKTLLPY